MIQGYLDTVSDGCLHGWAHNGKSPEPVVVTVCANGVPIGTVAANIYRPDVEQAGIGNGRHGFAFALPVGIIGDLTATANGTRLPGLLKAPSQLSEFGPHVRHILAKEYLKGEGVEIGALDKPMWVPDGIRVRTVDRLPTDELRSHYNLPQAVAVDYVSDAHTLETVGSGIQDFVLANHVFEHMENPLLALRNWVRVLRPGGILFMAIPDKRFTFDVDREVTPLAHILDEYEHPEHVDQNRCLHYEEWVRVVEHQQGDIQERLEFLLGISYSIHFHCWTAKELIELFTSATWIGYELDCYKSNRPECIFVLKKKLL